MATPTARIFNEAREALALLKEYDGSFIQYDHTKSYSERFNRADQIQLVGILQRLVDTNVGEGISEAEAALFSKAVNATFGYSFGEKGSRANQRLWDDNNPIAQLIVSLRRYSLVKDHAIHIEIKNELPLDKSLEMNPAVVEQVYKALKTRIDKLADNESQGGLFLQQLIQDKSATARGKFEAVLSIINLGATEDLAVLIATNPRYSAALEYANKNAQPKETHEKIIDAAKDAMERIDDGKLPRRGFFAALTGAVITAAAAPVVGPVVNSATTSIGAAEGMEARVNAAMRALKELPKTASDADRQAILMRLAQPEIATDIAKGAIASSLTYYLENKEDPLTQFLSYLSTECDKFSYPVFTFGKEIKPRTL